MNNLLNPSSHHCAFTVIKRAMEESASSITGYGDSASTLQSQSSALSCYDKYRQTNGLPELNAISRDVFCSETFFQKFAFYLTDIYRTKHAKTLLKLGTSLSYIGCLMVIGETKLFKGSEIKEVQSCHSMVILSNNFFDIR